MDGGGDLMSETRSSSDTIKQSDYYGVTESDKSEEIVLRDLTH